MILYYPINLNVQNKKVVIIGGGDVSYRKTTSLLFYGAKVCVISPDICRGLQQLKESSKILHINRNYTKGDLKDAFIAIAATDNPVINQKVAQEAKLQGVLVNVVDNPQLSDFIVPAVVKQGDLIISISTSGKSPLLAKKIKEELKRQYGEEYVTLLELLGDLRETLKQKFEHPDKRKQILSNILEKDLPGLLKKGMKHKVERIINQEVAKHEACDRNKG